MDGDVLNATKDCPICKRTGSVEDKNSTSGTKECEACKGMGAVLDNFIPDLLVEYYPEAKRSDMAKTAGKIYKHYENKLKESYERGKVDARAEFVGNDAPAKGSGATGGEDAGVDGAMEQK